MASRQVAKYLQDLHGHCKNPSLDAPSMAQQTILNLTDLVLQNLTNEEQDLCSSMLFEPSESSTDLLTEFVTSLIDKRFAIVRYHIIKLIIDYIDHIDKNIELYAPRIQSSMIKCVNTDQSDKTRGVALQCLDKLYLLNSFDMHSKPRSSMDASLNGGKSEADDDDDEDNDIKMNGNDDDGHLMNIDNVINTFYSNLNLGVSKLRGSVRGGILRLLGILSNRYPTKFTRIYLDKLSKLYTKYIGEALKDPSSLTPGLIAGCLTGLEYFLNEHCDFIPVMPKSKKGDNHNMLTVFKMIMITTRTIDSESRYNLVVASLDLLGRHSFIFLPFIMKMMEGTAKLKRNEYDKNKKNDIMQLVLDLVIRHGNMNVTMSGMNCVESMLASVTGKLLENKNDKNKKIFTMLLTIFGKLLSKSIQSGNQNNMLTVNNKSISLSIRAFGQLSSTINEYAKAGTLKNLLTKLVEVSKKCFVLSDNSDDVNTTSGDKGAGGGGDEGHQNSMIRQFPAFLTAFSSIIYHIDFIDDHVIDQLSLMIIMIYKGFPSTWNKLREKLYQSMIRLFVVLYLKGNIFNKLLEVIIYKGLTFSITTLEENIVGTKITDSSSATGIRIRHCYEEYYGFWKGLLMIGLNIDDNDDSLKWNKGLHLDMQQTQTYLYEMRSLLFSSLMQNLIEIMQQFNLSFKIKDAGADIMNYQMIMNNISENAELENANDMELFLNYVEFIQLFLSKICREYLMNQNKTRKRINPYFIQFQTWSLIFIETVIEKSNSNPMISGLYKILKTVFSLYASSSTQANMNEEELKDEEGGEEEEEDILMLNDDNKDDDGKAKGLKLDFYHKSLIRNYIDKCLSKLQTYRDELLYSCIELLLNIPKSFLPIKYLIPALLRSLKIGLTHIPAGELAIDVLEKWCDEHFDDIKEYFNVILPNLEPYLLITKETVAGISSNDDEDEDSKEFDEDDEKKIMMEDENEQKYGQQRANKVKKQKLNNIDEENLEYRRKKRLIRRILLFLGKLGGYNQALLGPKTDKMVKKHISSAEAAGKGLQVDTDIIAWDKHLRVRYVWGFPDTKLTLYLDPLLPRICELAQHSTNRRTKVAACEALHGIIIKMVRDNATDPNMDRKKQKTDFERIYMKLFPVLLNLAVSIEKVCNQLFRPLVIQLIHWFTQNIKKDNDETMALLDAITDGLGNENDASLRDFCGECMAEFVKWSLKNSGTAAGSLNIQSLLRRLYALVRHPSAYRRLGACLTFHYIYRNIREEKLLVSRFILDILTNLIESLAIAHYDTSGINTIDETRRCIKHFENIITNQKHGFWDTLNKIDKQRQGGDHCQELSTFIEWLFENLGRVEIDCRRQCMMLIQSLSPVSRPINNASKQACKSVSKWFGFVIKQRKVQYIVSVFEGGRMYDDDNIHSVLRKLPKLPHDAKYQDSAQQFPKIAMITKFKKWAENLSTSLDDYYWMINCKVIENNDANIIGKIFTQKHFQSFLFASCKHFLASLKILNKVSFTGAVTLKKQVNKLRCDTTIRFYRFIDIMLRNNLFKVVEELFKFQLFYQLLFESLVVPDVIGFIKDDPSRIKELQNQFRSLISSVCAYATDDKYKKYIIKITQGYITGKYSPHSGKKQTLSIKFEDWTSAKFFQYPGKALLFLRGIEILSKTNDVLQLALKDKKDGAATKMADDAFALCDEPLPPMNIKICGGMLSLALRLGLPTKSLMQYLGDQSKIPLAHSNITAMLKRNKQQNDMMDQDEDEEDILAVNDEEMLLGESEQMQNGSKGLVFYERFSDVLDSYFLANFNKFSKIIIQRIGDKKIEESEKRQLMLILTTVLKHIIEAATKEETQQFLTKLVTQFSSNNILDTSNEENVRLHLSIIRQYLIQCGSNTIFTDDNKNNKIANYIQTIYSNALKNGNHPGAQLQAIAMLPLFIVDPDNLLKWLLHAIHEMICNSFPASSKEAYERSRTEWKDYVQKLQSILDTIIISESFALLKVTIPLFREKEHKNKQQINSKLDRLIGNLTVPLKQESCLKFLTFAV